MYCAKCGVKLADTEKFCPLCGTTAYHPELTREEGNSIYPKRKYPAPEEKALGFPIFLTAVFLVPLLTVLVCDLRFTGGITWSGIVAGALIMLYVLGVLPLWFKRPNPVIFVPCSFGAVGLYICYLNLVLEGDWFMSFAFPILGCVTVIVVTTVVLLKYVRRGALYIFGGAFMATGGMMLLMEFLLGITFENINFIGWSFYPMVSLAAIGGVLIFMGICRPAREAIERKFFI